MPHWSGSKKNSPKVIFRWSPDCQEAFEKTKTPLVSEPVLASPDVRRPIALYTDASNVGAGAVLLQKDYNNVEHSVGYFSKKFPSFQKHYSTI